VTVAAAAGMTKVVALEDELCTDAPYQTEKTEFAGGEFAEMFTTVPAV
jgi:hypothetical protein